MTTDTIPIKNSPPITDEEAEPKLPDYNSLRVSRDAGELTNDGGLLYQEGSDHPSAEKPPVRCKHTVFRFNGNIIKRLPVAPRPVPTVEDNPGPVPLAVDAAGERYDEILGECLLLQNELRRINEFVCAWKHKNDN